MIQLEWQVPGGEKVHFSLKLVAEVHLDEF